MSLVCGGHVGGICLVCGRYVVDILSVLSEVVDKLLAYGRHVVSI